MKYWWSHRVSIPGLLLPGAKQCSEPAITELTNGGTSGDSRMLRGCVLGLNSFDGALSNGATAAMPFINGIYFSGEEV